MKDSARQSARLIWKFRFLLAVLVLLVTLLAAQQLASLGVSNSLEIWYPQDDPELINYREFQATYGSDEIVVLAVRGDAVFSTDDGGLLVGDLTDRILDIDGVATVTSLVTVPESLAEVRGRLLSADGETTALVVQMMVGQDIEARRHDLFIELREVAAEFGLESYLGGYGVVFEGLNEASTTGATMLIVTAHVVMVLLLLFFFRRSLPVLLTLLAVGTATIWTMGLYAATGHQLNMVTMVLPTLVLVIGIADCMHILRSVAAIDPGLDQSQRVIDGLATVIGPCFLMTITTAAGFLGLTTSGLPVVQQLGWFGAAGMIAAFVTAFVLVTSGLSWAAFEPANEGASFDRLAKALHDIGLKWSKVVVGIFLVLAALSVYGITQLNSDTDSIGYLKKSHIVRQDSDFIEAQIGPYVPIEFTVSVTGDLFTPEYLDAVWAWQERVIRMDNIGWSWSLISAFDLGPGESPSSAGMQALRDRLDRMQRFSPVTTRAMVSDDDELRISFGAPIMSARSVQSLIRRITAEVDLPEGMTLRPAGYSPLYTRIVDEIVTSQLRGFSSAIILIVVLLGIAMRSWRRILLALAANVVPVALTLGLMGLTGIPLDVASATIASVILGLVVDDTVHLLRPHRPDGVQASLSIAAGQAGGTLIMTSIVLAGGFLVLGLAEIRSIAWFGVLTSFAVIVAIISDLTLLPALAKLGYERKALFRTE
ncbi:MAG: MMPL family transporter [Gammaproteobacteria bacterium]|nr:MMPL family transporter [Gammaproteobacteria bacterium]